MNSVKKILIVLMLMACVAAQAQLSATSNFRKKKIATNANIKIDSFSIVAKSINLKNIDTNFYTIDYINSIITWKKKTLADSVEVAYRVFPYNFKKTYKRFNYDSIKNNFIAAQPFIFNNNSQNNFNNNDATFINFGKINYSGSLGRNLSFGNNQDAVFNSQLNLQLSGIIGDSIELSAAITDNNIPIQPDGSTQRLNEFDKILLQFKKKNWQLSLGDIDVKQKQNYFLNFYKRLQGVDGTNNPWFKLLPYAPNKGEALIVEIPNLPRTNIYKNGISIVPWKDNLFWIGSSYEWSFSNNEPTEIFRKKTEIILNNWLKLPYKIVEHFAAVRPANIERRPFIGLHPTHQQIGILNGMGTKGCSLAPYFANELVEHLINNQSINPNVDVQRFSTILSK